MKISTNYQPITGHDSSQEHSNFVKHTMSGWQIHKYKGMAALKFSNEIPIPKIQSPTDVLIEVHTSSVNPLDVMMMGEISITTT